MYLDINKMKNEITIRDILNHYGVNLKSNGQNRLSGSCPIHNGNNKNAFHVDLNKNLFNCFTHCGGGSIFDFVMKKENLSFHEAAMKIRNIFYPQHYQKKQHIQLNYQLNEQYNHPYLKKRNINYTLARYFQMKYCTSGFMKHRILIPIFDFNKKYVVCCGRTVDDRITPKYLFPKNFSKAHYIFNIQNIIPSAPKPVFIVEGFFDCIHINKNGFDVIAIMGSSISNSQLKLLKDLDRHYILMLDGDDTGIKAMPIIGKKMKQFDLNFKSIYILNNKEPESLNYDELELFARNI